VVAVPVEPGLPESPPITGVMPGAVAGHDSTQQEKP